MRFSLRAAFGLVMGFLVGSEALWASAAVAAEPGATEADTIAPEAHFRLPDPAELPADRARDLYFELQPTLARAYRMSGFAEARRYADWLKAARAPFRSATHGERYVQVHVNWLASGYLLGPKVALPPGATIVKDSFTATAAGSVFPGPLFLMERLEPGSAPDFGDWRYAMVMPDGSVLGDSRGFNPAAMAFCYACHATDPAAENQLFYVPAAYRVSAE